MIKLNRKLKSNSPKTKIKLPKIEIDECKMKTRDQKKLENEMFQQAKEAKLMLDKLLSEEGFSDMNEEYNRGRTRSNSLNATMEKIILSKHHQHLNANMKPRGSVPTITAHITKLFSRSRNNSPPQSPNSSPKNLKRFSPLPSPLSSPGSEKKNEGDIFDNLVKVINIDKEVVNDAEDVNKCTENLI